MVSFKVLIAHIFSSFLISFKCFYFLWFFSTDLVIAFFFPTLVSFCLWKSHGERGLADFISASWAVLSTVRAPRGSDICSNCITANLGWVSPMLLFISHCEMLFVVQNLIYRCSLDKIDCGYSTRHWYGRHQWKWKYRRFFHCSIMFGIYQLGLSLWK